MESNEDKTEEATPHKLEEAREKGDVAKSREFANFFVFLGCALTLYFTARFVLSKLISLFHTYFRFNEFHVEDSESAIKLFGSALENVLVILGPLFFVVVTFAIAGYLSQFGFLFTTKKISPKLDKLNFIQGFQRLFQAEMLVELVKSSAKVIILAAIFYLIFMGETEELLTLGVQPVGFIFMYAVKLISFVALVALIFMGILGAIDFAWQKWNYARKMRMTPQEVKEELKHREGDPHIRARIRQLQRERARQRMMEKVPKADVVVTNPTHVAVALQYKRGMMRAPIVIAKGAGFIALKIKEIAAEAGVPIVEKRELARYLYRHVELEEMIPESLYTAVAEVLAYVFRVKRRYQQWAEAMT